MNQTKRKRVGLALGGGAARGLAHIGVLQILTKEKIPIDFVAGTSAGAIVGAAYASTLNVERMTREALAANWKRMTPFIDPSLHRSGFIKGNKIRDLIADFIGGDIDFSDTKIPFACVATDIDTGEEVVMNTGPVLDALRASISIPGIFSVAKYGERYLVDGGLTTPVPTDVVRKMGADLIIGVGVNPDISGRMGKAFQHRVEAHKEPNIIQVMMQSIYITSYSLARASLDSADVAIEPDVAHVGAGEFHKAEELIIHGREAAEEAIPEIKRKLGELL